MKRIGIFGTSGMARETGDIAWALGYEPVYVARNAAERDDWRFDEEVLLESAVGRFTDMPFSIGIADAGIRGRLAARFADRLRFAPLVHPSATFGRGQRERAETCSGLIVAAGVRMTSNITLGEFCILNQNATITHDVVLGPLVHVAPGAIVSGNVRIGNGCWIGAGAVVNQGLTIGAGTTVGSGAVVTRDCEADAVYAGVPARRIK